MSFLQTSTQVPSPPPSLLHLAPCPTPQVQLTCRLLQRAFFSRLTQAGLVTLLCTPRILFAFLTHLPPPPPPKSLSAVMGEAPGTLFLTQFLAEHPLAVFLLAGDGQIGGGRCAFPGSFMSCSHSKLRNDSPLTELWLPLRDVTLSLSPTVSICSSGGRACLWLAPTPSDLHEARQRPGTQQMHCSAWAPQGQGRAQPPAVETCLKLVSHKWARCIPSKSPAYLSFHMCPTLSPALSLLLH